MAFQQILRDTVANWENQNTVLGLNQIGVESDLRNNIEYGSGLTKLGNGIDGWNDLPYWNTQIQSAVLEADFPNTDGIPTEVTDWTLNLLAGRWYRVTGWFRTDNPNVGSNLNFAGGSVTATGIRGSVTFVEDGVLGLALITALSDLIELTTGTQSNGFVDFTIQVNAGGTLIPLFYQTAADATPNYIFKYATLQAIDVTPE